MHELGLEDGKDEFQPRTPARLAEVRRRLFDLTPAHRKATAAAANVPLRSETNVLMYESDLGR